MAAARGGTTAISFSVMPNVKFCCPHCLQHIQCDETWFGRVINCPNCRKDFLAPEAISPAPPRQPEPSPFAPVTAPPALQINVEPNEFRSADRLAHASILLSLASLLLGPLGFVPGIICGHLARRRTRGSGWATTKRRALAGLVVGYTFAALGFTVVAAWLILDGGKRSRPQSRSQTPSRVVAQSNPARKNELVAWTMRPENHVIPQRFASGMIRGMAFHPEVVSVENGVFKLRQGRGTFPDLEVSIFLPHKEGKTFSSQTFEIQPDAGGVATPHVWIQVKPPGRDFPEQQAFPKGYLLRLEFGPASQGSVSGKIYLALPDAEKSFVTGTFTAEMK